MSKNYKREIIINKLSRKGLKPKPDTQHIEYFLVPNNIHLGIKTLGMIDFLKIPIRRPEYKDKDNNKKPKPKIIHKQAKTIGKCIVCNKEVTNNTGFFRLTQRNKIIKIHNGKCKRQADILLDSGLTLRDIKIK